jgi:hypothetical protein
MGSWPSWWTIGVTLGFGVAIGLFLASAAASRRTLVVVAALLAAGAGVAIGLLVWRWDSAAGGAAGGVAGAAAGRQIVAGAIRRGGTRGGLVLIVGGVALLLGALALVPGVGYIEALALPALAARLRRRAPERYAGLRTLARD